MKLCCTCKYYAEFEGVCTNGDSEYCADFTDSGFACEQWQGNKIHTLKIMPQYFTAVVENRKTFELRQNDRDYQVGDLLLLKEFFNNEFTGNEIVREVTYVLKDCPAYGLQSEFCILGIKPIKNLAGWDFN